MQENGLLNFIKNITKTTIHTPLATFSAMLSFAVFGNHDWAPYAFNCFIIFIMLFAVNKLIYSIDRDVCVKFLFYIFLLSVPFVGYTVHEFRPDLPAGLFTAKHLK